MQVDIDQQEMSRRVRRGMLQQLGYYHLSGFPSLPKTSTDGFPEQTWLACPSDQTPDVHANRNNAKQEEPCPLDDKSRESEYPRQDNGAPPGMFQEIPNGE
jgi:hypothetical protein